MNELFDLICEQGKFWYNEFKKPVFYALAIGLVEGLIIYNHEKKDLELKIMIANGIQGNFVLNENNYD
ncbi:MAG: hypothetical protein ABH811_02975 [archaeon]